MALTVAKNAFPKGHEATQYFYHVYGTLTFSGSYSTGGEAVNWATMLMPTQSSPIQVWIQSQGVSGWLYFWDVSTGKIMVFGQHPTSATTGIIPLEELAAAAYPASVTGDTVVFHAIFPRN